MNSLDCHVYYDSTRHPAPPSDCLHPVDLASSPEAAAANERLARLGVSVQDDLPAVVLTEPGGKIRLLGVRLTPEETAQLAAGRGIGAGRLVVYSTSWCGDCRNAKRVLQEAAAPFSEIDLDRDRGAEALVLQKSGGRRVVPTLQFDGRLWAFNPPPPLLRRLLAGAGPA
jgi:mycoredoxin